MRKKQRVYNLAKRSQNPKHWKKFKDLRKIGKQSLQEAQNDYVFGLLKWSEKRNSQSMGKNFGHTSNP